MACLIIPLPPLYPSPLPLPYTKYPANLLRITRRPVPSICIYMKSVLKEGSVIGQKREGLT